MLCALFATNVLPVWCRLFYGHPVMTPGQIANGTGYAFVPFLVALIVARFLTKSLRRTQNPQSLPNLGSLLSAWLLTKRPTTRRAFLTNLEITLSLTLVLASLAFVASLEL